MFHDYFRYEKSTGHIYWKVDRGNMKLKGRRAGYTHREGYSAVYFMGKGYLVHRVVWHMHHGSFPVGEIDHVNGIRNDNRIENLRDVPKQVNLSNSYRHRAGKLVGTHYEKRRKKWRARAVISKQEFFLGYFDTEIAAHKAYAKFLEA